MSLFGLQNKSFGLDISQRAFRVVQLKKYGSKIKLVSYNQLAIPQGTLKDGKVTSVDKTVELIKKLVAEAKGQKIVTKFVTACLAEQKTFIKVIKLNYPEGKNILDEIVQETKKHIPYTLDEVYLDWQYIHRNQKDKVLIGVCPKEIVNNYQEILQKAGLTPIALEIEGAAIVRSIFPSKQKFTEPVMILDLGASRTGLIIYENGSIPFSLSLSFSSNDLTKILQEQLKLTFIEAEKAKNTCGLDENKAQGFTRKILEKEVLKLAQSIREASYSYKEHFSSNKSIAKLYLTGGGSLIPGLDQFLKGKVNMDVAYCNPLINISPSIISLPKDEILSYTTAIGLALRSFLITG